MFLNKSMKLKCLHHPVPSTQQPKISTSSWPKCCSLWSGRGHKFCEDQTWCQPPKGSQDPRRKKNSTGSFADFRGLGWWQGRDTMGSHNQTSSLAQPRLFPMETRALQLSPGCPAVMPS